MAVSMALPLAGGIMGSIFTAKSVKTWYPTLKKPSWTPPNWLFGPVWTCLYTAMGYASWRVFNLGGFEKQAVPLSLYALQLALNFAWSPLFFGAKKTGLALIDISAMGVAAGATAFQFWTVDPLASKLLWPYLFWISYATALNTYIFVNNPPRKDNKEQKD
eukprot:CAMPEP_0197486650 /NCGR_PEP_ID=MMETSP1311-20131121/1618_1 /TAXON_ID=464262 /ORGANISM="Genus nov. species nov., Strain RCC856" /LENGTH=160 /DNA_ID=CAMNT_0043029859 /DNA_START=33 /DNA_END=515 /DNA_ORIENTATION=-